MSTRKVESLILTLNYTVLFKIVIFFKAWMSWYRLIDNRIKKKYWIRFWWSCIFIAHYAYTCLQESSLFQNRSLLLKKKWIRHIDYTFRAHFSIHILPIISSPNFIIYNIKPGSIMTPHTRKKNFEESRKSYSIYSVFTYQWKPRCISTAVLLENVFRG